MFMKVFLGLALVGGLVATPFAIAAINAPNSSACCACCGDLCTCEDCVCDANGCACDTGGSCVCAPPCCKTCCDK
jgi:hypothetical protein